MAEVGHSYIIDALPGITLGLVTRYNEIEQCLRSDCESWVLKTEKILLHIAFILGFASPSRLVWRVVRELLTQISFHFGHYLDNHPSFEDKVRMVVSTLEYVGLAQIWDFVRDSSICMRFNNCDTEFFGQLSNIKIKQCGLVNMDIEDLNDDTRPLSTCEKIFNDSPLIMLAVGMTVLAFIADAELKVPVPQGPDDQPADGQPVAAPPQPAVPPPNDPKKSEKDTAPPPKPPPQPKPDDDASEPGKGIPPHPTPKPGDDASKSDQDKGKPPQPKPDDDASKPGKSKPPHPKPDDDASKSGKGKPQPKPDDDASKPGKGKPPHPKPDDDDASGKGKPTKSPPSKPDDKPATPGTSFSSNAPDPPTSPGNPDPDKKGSDPPADPPPENDSDNESESDAGSDSGSKTPPPFCPTNQIIHGKCPNCRKLFFKEVPNPWPLCCSKSEKLVKTKKSARKCLSNEETAAERVVKDLLAEIKCKVCREKIKRFLKKNVTKSKDKSANQKNKPKPKK